MKKTLLLFFLQINLINSQEVELGSNNEINPLKVYDNSERVSDEYLDAVIQQYEEDCKNFEKCGVEELPEPAKTFCNGIRGLPASVQKQAWINYAGGKMIDGMDKEKAKLCAELYKQNQLLRDKKNSKKNEDAGCIIN